MTELMYVYGILGLVAGFIALIASELIKAGNLVKAHTRNAHIKTAIDFAEQAVISVSNSQLANSENKERAMDVMTKRLAENGLLKHFTQEQIKTYIKQALNASEK